MNITATKPLVWATVELRRRVTVAVNLPDGVTPEEAIAAIEADEPVNALPLSLRGSLRSAAFDEAAANITGTKLAEIHSLEVL